MMLWHCISRVDRGRVLSEVLLCLSALGGLREKQGDVRPESIPALKILWTCGRSEGRNTRMLTVEDDMVVSRVRQRSCRDLR